MKLSNRSEFKVRLRLGVKSGRAKSGRVKSGGNRTILYVLTLKCCVSKYSRLKRTSTGRRGIAMSLSTRSKDRGRPSARTQPLWRPKALTSAHTRPVSAVSRASTTMLLLNSTRLRSIVSMESRGRVGHYKG